MGMQFDRRSLLRGALAGAGVVVGIPTLDCFLDNHGRAYADGAKLPMRFGTYFWGLGLTPGRWIPDREGKAWWSKPGSDTAQLPVELESLRGIHQKISVMSGFRVHLDGKPNLQHFTGQAGIMSGAAPSTQGVFEGPSFDTAVADAIGAGSRFRAVDIAPYGQPVSHSTRTGSGMATPDTSPLQLYTRLFGEGFQDPNSDHFTPDPNVMLRKSVLSAIGDQRTALLSQVGKTDRDRLDQYFTSVRQVEQTLAVQLEKPAKCESCVVPAKPTDLPSSREIGVVARNNKLMADLMAMGLACNQTKVFNVGFSNAQTGLYLAGDSAIYHLHTHDEAVDVKLGYQPISAKLAELSLRSFGDFLRSLDAIKEGDGTLLDHSLVMSYTDTGYAKIHSVDNIPMFLAGGANGAHKTGQHILGKDDPVTRVSLTAMQLAGVPVGQFGMGAMKTGKSISEVIA